MPTNKINVQKELVALDRHSSNGHEVTVCIQQRATTDWSWVAIRYPLNMAGFPQSTQVLKDFKGRKWSEIIDWVREYLTRNPADGFAYC